MVSTTRTLPGSKLHHSLGAWPILINDETEVIIDEDAVSGPGRLVPPPLRGLTLRWRSVEAGRRLACVAERRTA